jgi:hypothetical protein
LLAFFIFCAQIFGFSRLTRLSLPSAVSKTCAAPIERIKLLLQNQVRQNFFRIFLLRAQTGSFLDQLLGPILGLLCVLRLFGPSQ